MSEPDPKSAFSSFTSEAAPCLVCSVICLYYQRFGDVIKIHVSLLDIDIFMRFTINQHVFYGTLPGMTKSNQDFFRLLSEIRLYRCSNESFI